MALISSLTPSNVVPSYSTSKENWTRDRGGTKRTDGWWHIDQKWLILLSEQWKTIKEGLHDSLPLGRDGMSIIVFWLFTGKGLLEEMKRVTQACVLCVTYNPGGSVKPPPFVSPVQRHGTYPREDWQIGFTQMPSFEAFDYLLVSIDNFTGWIEVFSTRTERAIEVTKTILKEIIPRFDCPITFRVATDLCSRGLTFRQKGGVAWGRHESSLVIFQEWSLSLQQLEVRLPFPARDRGQVVVVRASRPVVSDKSPGPLALRKRIPTKMESSATSKVFIKREKIRTVYVGRCTGRLRRRLPESHSHCCSHTFWETSSLRTVQIVECSLSHRRAQGRVSS